MPNRAAIVTGASRGIGRALAEALAADGYDLTITARKPETIEEAAEALRASGASVEFVTGNLGDEAVIQEVVRAHRDRYGRLDVLVNNAGWSTRVPHPKLHDLTDDIWDRTFDVNLRGLFYCVRAATPLLRRQPGAAIVNVASVAGSTGVGSSMAYAAAKAGVITMTKSLARALAPEIRVNAISPGLIRTHFAGRPDSDSDFTAEEVATPLKRLATVDECAEVALFLACSATAVTGQTILVDGGLYVLGPNR
jgi:3-oxoacyl-[acyl-carrier protein] reductase